jgi:cation/acetate symporter
MAGLRRPEADVGALRAPLSSCLAALGLFALLLLALGLLERLGMGSGGIPYAVIAGMCALSIVIAFMSHGRRPADFYLADRIVVARLGGLAGASVLAGLLVIGLAGGAFATGAELAAASSALAVGVAFSALFIAPRLHRFGGHTTGDFVAARFGSNRARVFAAIVAFTASLFLLIACLQTVGPLLAAMTGAGAAEAVYAAAALTALAVLPGGMRALTWTQVFQYFVVALACLAPAVLLAVGNAASDAGASAVGGQGMASLLAHLVSPLTSGSPGEVLPLLPLLAAGAASLPPLFARVLAAPSAPQASSLLLWTVLFTVAVVAGALVLGQSLAEATGLTVLGPGSDLFALTMPLLAALPSVLAGLVMAGAVAALLAVGQAALFSAATALSNDIWNVVVDRQGPEGRRILVARVLLVAVTATAALLALRWPIDGPTTLAWGFAYAAAGSVVPLLAGLWWRRCNAVGATLGIACGFVVICVVLFFDLGVLPDWAAVGPSAKHGPVVAASLGVPAAFFATIAGSLLSRARRGNSMDYGARSSDAERSPPTSEKPAWTSG